MVDGALKVALLAREGDARSQLRRALAELGAELVLEADPGHVDANALAGSGARAVLFSVEPATEPALDRLDEVLADPTLSVIFDEAETTAKLDGWDLNRWARHLAAKLLGRDVLPPGAPAAEHHEAATHLEPGIVRPTVVIADEAIAAFAVEAGASADAVPSAPRLDDRPEAVEADASGIPSAAEAPSWAAPPEAPVEALDLALDLEALDVAMAAPAEAPRPLPSLEEPTLDVGEIDLRGLELVDDAPVSPSLSTASSADAGAMEVEELTLSEAELAAFGDLDTLSFSSASDDESLDAIVLDASEAGDSLELDPELARLAASLDEQVEAQSRVDAPSFDPALAFESEEPLVLAEPPAEPAPATPARDWLASSSLSLDESEPAAAPAAPAAASPRFDLSALELAPIDDLPAASPVVAEVPSPVVDVDTGHLSLAPIGDEPDVPPAPVSRVVLVLSGIGGPDAVRHLVRALPTGFPAAVLLQQALDGGRHDRYVEQLARISRLPVALAAPRETPPAREIRVLADGAAAAGGLDFSAGPAALIEAVQGSDGAIVVLSGADTSLVEPIAAAMGAGVRVIVQDPASCFDGKAAEALRAAGAPAVAATDLAARLDACFPS